MLWCDQGGRKKQGCSTGSSIALEKHLQNLGCNEDYVNVIKITLFSASQRLHFSPSAMSLDLSCYNKLLLFLLELIWAIGWAEPSCQKGLFQPYTGFCFTPSTLNLDPLQERPRVRLGSSCCWRRISKALMTTWAFVRLTYTTSIEFPSFWKTLYHQSYTDRSRDWGIIPCLSYLRVWCYLT